MIPAASRRAPLRENHLQNIVALRAQRHAHTDLMSLQRHRVGHHAEYSDDHQEQRDRQLMARRSSDQTRAQNR